MENNLTEIFGEVIYSYTRKQAIEDGVLTDISKLASEAGFKYPTVISEGVAALIEDAVNKGGKDWDGIVWDILTMLKYYIKKCNGARCDFEVLIWSKYTGKDARVKMYSLCHGGDNSEPVITIMLPNED